MSFARRLSAGVKRHLSNINEMRDRQVVAAEQRARVRMARAKTRADKEKAKLQLEREKLKIQKEVYEAKIATQKAKIALKKARKEAGDLTIGERLGQTYRAFAKPKRRTSTRKKATRRRSK